MNEQIPQTDAEIKNNAFVIMLCAFVPDDLSVAFDHTNANQLYFFIHLIVRSGM